LHVKTDPETACQTARSGHLFTDMFWTEMIAEEIKKEP